MSLVNEEFKLLSLYDFVVKYFEEGYAEQKV